MKVEKVLVIKTTSEKRILLEGSVGFDDAGAEAARHTRGHMERSRHWSVTRTAIQITWSGYPKSHFFIDSLFFDFQ